MKRYVLCSILFLTLPLSASIGFVRSNHQWSGGVSSCQVVLSTTGASDLLVVWGEWQTSPGTPNTVTASVSDLQNNGTGNPKTFPTAVGVTVQSASRMASQIFYAGNIVGGGSDTVTITFSGTVSTSACVAAEYSGADLSYPLDSVSAGHGNSTGTKLDSGYAAPTNTNLMVFGAGINDAPGAPTTTLPFVIRESNASGFCALAEDNVTPTTGSLQHADATCAASGNWLMQMAVFRTASPTVTGGWSPSRPSKILYADQYPGNDACIQIANAFADAPPSGGIVDARGLIPTTGGGNSDLFGESDSYGSDRPAAA